MLSLPIPYRHGPQTFDDVHYGDGYSLSELIRQLQAKPFDGTGTCHLDPDLNRNSIRREKNWRPAFGQQGKDQSHLEKNGVGKGSLFLFFGRFRHVASKDGTSWSFLRGSHPIHVIYGWLCVGKTLKVKSSRLLEEYPWLKTHPHLNDLEAWSNNTVYLPPEKIEWLGGESEIPGAGTFKFHSDLVLTKKGRTASFWLLPDWFQTSKNQHFSRFYREKNIELSEGESLLKTSGIWQELVIRSEDYPGIELWVKKLFDNERRERIDSAINL